MNTQDKDGYIYIFEKLNKEIILTELITAFRVVHRSQNEASKPKYLGRVKEVEYKLLQPALIRAVKAYKESLTSGNKALQEEIEDNHISGIISEGEDDFFIKVQAVERSLMDEVNKKLIEKAEMVLPPSDIDAITPYGRREEILNMAGGMANR